MQEKMQFERVVWIDIYKALAICFMVIGHATDLYNEYIYQFHMAAFFFISGYFSKQKKDGFVRTFFDKLYSIILPLFMLLLANAVLMAVLNYFGYYKIWFGTMEYIGFKNILRQFFLTGALYTWWLGAAWFLIALFFVVLLSKCIYNLANGNNRIYFVFSLFLYLFGYQFIKYVGIRLPYSFDIVLIAQFFYSMGFLLKEENIAKTLVKKMTVDKLIVLVAITSIIFYLCAQVPGVNISYTDRSFSNVVLNTLTSFNGISWLFGVSQLLAKINNKHILKLLTGIGRNTLGIVLLHFAFFKISYIILYFLGVISKGDISRITPSQSVGYDWWGGISLLAIICCVFVWEMVSRIPVFSFVMGLDKQKYKCIEQRILQRDWASRYRNCMNKFYGKRPLVRKYISCFLCVLCFIISLFWMGYAKWLKYTSVDITFPTQISNVRFEGGWLSQGNEDYRWINEKATVEVETNCQKKLTIEGYVPENFSEVQNLRIFVNSELLGTVAVKEESSFVKEYDLHSVKIGDDGTMRIDFEFDGSHAPESGSEDKRVLSGFLSRIHIE